MLRRLLFFLCLVIFLADSYSQTFRIQMDQSLDATKDSILVDLYVSLAAPGPTLKLGASNFSLKFDTSNLDIFNGAISFIPATYNNPLSYNPMTLVVNPSDTFITLNLNAIIGGSTPNAGDVTISPELVARLSFPIKDHCDSSYLDWVNGIPGPALSTYDLAVNDADPIEEVTPSSFLLRDSIGGTINVLANTDTVCEGSTVDIELLLSGEGGFNVLFNNGTDNYTVQRNSGDISSYTVTAPVGVNTFTITQITDTNGCVETTAANFTSDDVFIDETVSPAIAGPDQDICGRTTNLAATPLVVGLGTWSQIAGPTGSTTSFTDANDPTTAVSVDSVVQYEYQWRASSILEGVVTSGAACPADADTVVVNYFRQPTVANVGVTPFDTCVTGFPITLQLTGNVADSGSGIWTTPFGPIPTFVSSDTLNNATISIPSFGAYFLDWTISNGPCPSTSAQLQINTEREPSNPIINTADFTTCDPSFPISAQVPAIGTGTWVTNFGGTATYDVSTNNNTNANFPDYYVDSTFQLIWQVNNNDVVGVCPIKTDTLFGTRFGQPNVTHSITGNSTPDCGLPFTYTLDNTTPGSNYNWQLPSGYIITNSFAPDSSSIEITLSDPVFSGSFIVTENTGSGCSGPIDTFSVAPINCLFQANFFVNDSINSDTAVCVGDVVNFVSNSSGVDGTTNYSWESSLAVDPVLPYTEFTGVGALGRTFSRSFAAAGTYIIGLEINSPGAPDNYLDTVQVVNAPVLSFNSVGPTTICFGDSAFFRLQVAGGLPPYSVTLFDGTTPYVFNNLDGDDTVGIPLTSSVTMSTTALSDQLACGSASFITPDIIINVTPNPSASLNLLSTTPFCDTDSILVEVNFSSGIGPFDVRIFKNLVFDTLLTNVLGPTSNFYLPNDNLGANNYSLDTITDSNGCDTVGGPSNVNVSVVDGIDSATFVGDTTICLGESTPLTATAFGGNPNYTFYFTGRPDAVQPNPFTFLDTPPATTSYILDSVDAANGCRVLVNETVTVSVNPLPTASIAGTATICSGENTPLTFTTSQASDTIYYSSSVTGIQPVQIGSGVVSVSPTSTANYTIDSVVSASGCVIVAPTNITGNPVTITVNPGITAATILGGDIICNGDSDSLIVNITGGTGPFNLTITNIGSVNPYNIGDSIGVSPGTTTLYTLTGLSDFNGCTFATPSNTTTTVNPVPAASIATSTPSICLGIPADIDLTFTAGTGPFNVTYTDGVNSYSNLGLTAPTATVQVTPLVDSIFNFVLDSIFDSGTGCFVTAPSANLTGIATVAVNPTTSPTVSVVQSPANPVCAGDLITFTVLATDTGSSPSWQWYQDDLPLAGQNSNTFSSTSPPLADGSEVKVELNVGAGCAFPSVVFDSVILDIQTTVTPSITLTQSPSNPVCNNDTITFDATIVGGGASPNIVWTLDGTPILPNDELSKTITSGYANGSVVRAILTSSFGCASPTGDTANATINVTGSVTPIVNIIQSPGNPVCAADSVFFVAQNTGGGASPSFVWRVNGAIQAGAVTDTFSYFPRVDLDSISVVMTSSSTCAAPGTASDGHILNIETSVTPLINVSQTPNGPVCPGEDVVFDATISGGGTSPTVRWYVDGVLEAISEDFTFFNAAAPGPYTVQGILTSNASCAPGLKTDTFTTTINIQSPVDPSVQIIQSPNNPVCVGDPVNFSVNATGQGANPTYQWLYNNTPVSTSPTYNAPSVADDDEVIVVLTSSNPGSCTSNPIAGDTVSIQTETNIPLAGTIVSDPVGVQYCPSQTVTFSFQGTGQGSNPTYAWTISSIGGIQSTDSTFTYTLPGASPAFYSVAVNVTSSNSCAVPLSQPFTAPVIVNPGALPIVDIVQSPGNPVCAGENINFTVNTQNEGINPTYAWFVNAVFQTSNPTGIYNSSTLADGDEVVVRLTTTACSGTATAFDTIIIQHDNPIIPQVEIDVTPDSVLCANEFVTFTANPSGQGPNPSYTWFIDGTPVSNGSFYTTSFGTAGTREVVLELNRNQACGGPTTDRDTMTVVVTTNGTVNVNILRTPAGPICNGDPVTFEATGTHVGLSPTYTWRKNGTIFSIGPVVSTTINNLDDIRVDVSYINPCSGASSTFAELNNIPTTGPGTPSVAIVQNPLNPICPNELIQFTTIDTLEGNSPNYRWYKNGALEVADPTYTYFATTADDTIIVEMTSSASCASPSTVRDTVITQFIQTDLDTAIGDTTTFCLGDSVTLILEDTNNVSIEWFRLTPSGADVSLGTNFSVSILETDSVYGLITNGRCTESTDTVIVSVFEPYTGTITASGATTGLCFGDDVTLSVDSTTGYNLQWLYGFDSIIGETDTFLTVNYTGSFNLIAENNACIDTIGAVNVQIAPPIDSIASILIGDSVFCEGDSVLLGVQSVRGNSLGGRLGSSYVQTPFAGIQSNGARSLEAWIQTDTTGGIMGYGSDANGQAFVVRIQNNLESPGQGNNGALKLAVKDGYITGTTNIADNNPHHIAVVFDGDSVNDVQLYVDGQLETVSSISNEIVNTVTGINFRIGTTNIGFTPSIRFGGKVDEVRFWDFALDTALIRNNAVIPLSGNEPGLVGLWNFEDTIGGTAKDLVAGNDGTLLNGARFIPEAGFYNPSPPVTYEWVNALTGYSYDAVPDTFAIWVDSTGDYYVNITNGTCTQTSDTISIREIILDPVITNTSPIELCIGDNVTLTSINTTSQLDSIVWLYGGNGFITNNDSSLIVDASGSYSVAYFDNGCSDTSNAIIVNVAAEIDTTMTIDGDTALCDGDTTFLSVPLNGGNNLRQLAKADVIRDIGNLSDFSFIHESGRFTIQYWQKLNNPAANNKINAAVGNAFDGTDPGFFAGYQRGNIGGINLNGQFKLHVDGGGAPWIFHTTGAQKITDTLWHQVTIVVDSNEAKFYLDNQLLPSTIALGTPVYATPPTPASNRVTIGDANSFPGVIDYTNRGGVDEVRIWNMPLDSATIANNWYRPLNGNEPGLVALFDLDEDTTLGAGDIVNDLSANAFTGTLNGTAQLETFENSMPTDSLTYQWYNGATAIPGATSNVLAVDTTGSYYVVISTANGLCADSSRVIDISSYSIDPEISVLNNDTVCFGDSVQLQALNNDGAIDSVRWFFGNYLVDSISNPYSATLSGLYTAVVFNNICSDTSTVQTVEIKKAIDSTLSVIGDSVLCVDDTVILSVPQYGSSSLFIRANIGNVNNVGVIGDFDYVHQTGEFAIEFWAKLETNANRVHSIVGNSNAVLNNGFDVSIIVNGSGDGRLRLRMFDGSSPFTFQSPNLTNATNFNQWNHFTISVENGLAKFYFNNVFVGQQSTGFLPIVGTASNPLTIGGPGTNLIGKLDELRLWKTSLTDQQISKNYQRPINFNPSLVTVFGFDADTSLQNGDSFTDNSKSISATINGVNVSLNNDNPFQPSTELTYQWFQDGTLITGAIGDSLLITTADFSDSAEYYVEIDNSLNCGPVPSRTIKIKENIISDTLFASPTEFCAGTDSARIWVDLNLYDSVQIYDLDFNKLASLTDPSDTFYVLETDTIYGLVFNEIDNRICTNFTDTVIITAFENPTVQFANDSLVICIDDSDTLFSFLRMDSVFGGTGVGTYTYNWTPGDSLSGNDSTLLQPVYTADTSGIFFFTLVATDTNGCFGQDSIKIVTYDRVVPTFTQDTYTICFGDSISLGDSLTVTGGKPGTTFKYLWNPTTLFDNPADSTSDNPLIVGDSSGTFIYTVMVTDSITNCSGMATITVVVGDSLRFNAFTDTLICFNTDSIQLGGAPTADGGTGTITYSWNPVSNLSDSLSPNPYFLNPGDGLYTYFITATDALGCFKTSDSINIEVAPEIVVNAGSDTVLCFGDTAVQIGGAPTASGGFGTFGYQWSSLTPSIPVTILNDPTLANPTVIYNTAVTNDSAIFVVTVFDTAALPNVTLCEVSDTVVVYFNPEIIADTGSVNFVCFDDTISLAGSATGGSMTGYAYAWGGDNQYVVDTTDNTSVINGTASGLYNLTLFAFDQTYPQCFDSASFTFKINDTLVAFTGIDTAICYGEQVLLGDTIFGTNDVTASGGSSPYIFNWTPTAGINNGSIQNPIFNTTGLLASGIYTYNLTVVDDSLCIARDTISIDLNAELFIDAGVNDSICFQDSLILGGPTVAFGGSGTGYQYQWTSSLGNTLITDTIEKPTLFGDIVGLDSVKIVVTDSRACPDSSLVLIEINPLPLNSFNVDSSFYICLGEDTTLISTGIPQNNPADILSYSWDNGVNVNINNVAPTTDSLFIVTVTNTVTGCAIDDTVEVIVNTLPDINITSGTVTPINPGSDTLLFCANFATALFTATNTNPNAGGNASRIWTANPSFTINNNTNASVLIFQTALNANGNYLINEMTDNFGCVNRDSVFLILNAFPNATFVSTEDTICFGDSVTLKVLGGPDQISNPGVLYAFNRNLPSTTNFATGIDTTISLIPGVSFDIPNLSITTPTIFEYEVQIIEGACISILVDTVVVNPLPQLNPIPPSDSVCFGQNIDLTVTNTLVQSLDSFIWGHTVLDTSLVNVTINQDSVFTVNVFDENGCSADTSIDIRVKNLPDVSLDTFGTISICEGNSFDISVLNPKPNYIYQWKDSSNIPTTIPNGITTNALYTADTSGQFFVVITTDGLACIDSSSAVAIIDNPLPTIALDTIPDSTRFCFGGSAILSELSGYPNPSYEWIEVLLGSVATGTNTITISDSGQYYVIITDANGCIDSSAIQEFFEIPFSVDSINSGPDTVCEFSQSSYTSTINGTWRLNATRGTIAGANLVSGFYITPSPINSVSITWNGPGTAQILYTPDIECAVEDTFTVTIVSNPVASIQGPTSGCFGDNLKLFALNGGDNYSWTILQAGFGTLTNNNDTTDLALNQPVVSLNGFDTSSIRLIQTNPTTGCVDTALLQITKYQFASAEFRPANLDTGVCLNEIDTFTIQNAVPNATYNFTVVGGTFVNLSNGQIQVNWNIVTTGSVQCIALNGDCSDTVFQEFTIQSSPVDTFSYFIDGFLQTTQITNVCVLSDSVTYRLQTPNLANTFTWNLQSTTATPTPYSAINNDTTFFSVAINTPGSYVLTMTESSSNGCSIVLQETVTIDDGATFEILIQDSVICETDSIQIYNTSGNFDAGSVGFNYSDPVNMSAALGSGNVTIDWGGPGIGKYVIAFYGNGACSAIDTFFVDVQALPNSFITPTPAQITNGPDTTFCENLRTFFFANPADTGFIYQWYNNGNPIPNSDTSRIRITESGTYSYSVQTLATGCIDSTIVGIPATVLGTPDAEIVGDSLWCGSGATITLTSVNSATNYRWFKDTTNAMLIDTLNRSIEVSEANSFFLVISNGGVGNCTDTSDVFVIEALAPPVSLFQFDSISSFCNNEEITLNGRNAGRLLNFEWITNGQGQIVDPFTDTTSYIPSDLDSGLLSFEFTVTNPCGVDISADTATLRPSPDASYTPSALVAEINETVIFTINNQDAIIYDWVFQAGATGSGPTGLHTYTQAGDYLSFLIATNEFNCSDSFAVPIHVTRNQLIYVPNVFSPNATNADNQVMRVYGTNISAVGFEIVIYNRWGIKVWESQDLTELKTNGWNGSQRNGAELPTGVYTYYIKGKFFNDEAFQQVGTVSLIK